ncbi:hypothetical protein ACP70R_042149 [Stipagrostis hirtigluma subsp. patula]
MVGMGRPPCCDQEAGVKKGPWTPEEDKLLVDYIKKHGHGSWRRLAKLAGLNRCCKSCRLRWNNYLRPDIKRGRFTDDEEKLIVHLHSILGNKWSSIAAKLPGRTDNDIKNYWNAYFRKKLLGTGIVDPSLLAATLDINAALKLQAEAAKLQLLQGLVGVVAAATAPAPSVDLTALLAASNGAAGQPAGLLLNLPAYTCVPDVAPGIMSSFAALLNGFGSGGAMSAVAEDGLSSSTELGHSGSSVTAAMATPLAATDEHNAGSSSCGGGGGTTPGQETPAPSTFEGLDNLNLDDLSNDNWKDLLEEMSWFNPNEL